MMYRLITLLFAPALAGMAGLLVDCVLEAEVEAAVPVEEGDKVSIVSMCTRKIAGGCVGSMK